ncbi:hypothetical protein [Streptomyces cinereoruber]|uniref:hypothetical protein n=1 Tax=Streptomyces cinereoruber TaxID=67260 RepID=UPI0036253DF2
MSRYEEASRVVGTALDSAARAGATGTAVTVAARFAEALTREDGQDEARLLLDTWTPGPGTPADAVAAHRLAHSVLHFVEGRHAEAVESAAGEERAERLGEQ